MSNIALTNANIYTMNPNIPKAKSLVVKDGHVDYVGLQDPLPSGVEVIDLAGRTILPGLCDSHIHLEKYALLLTKVDCEVPTLAECLKRVEDRCQGDHSDSWILGHGWNQNDWGRYGTLEELDSISHEHPVYLTAKSLHAAWANSKALQVCGITPSTPDPPNSQVVIARQQHRRASIGVAKLDQARFARPRHHSEQGLEHVDQDVSHGAPPLRICALPKSHFK